MDNVTVDIVGEEKVIRVAEGLADAMTNPQPIFTLVQGYMMEQFKESIKRARDPVTRKRWPALKRSTLDSKYKGRERRTYSITPLHRTMSGLNSVGPLRLNKQTVSIGTRKEYMLYHNSPPVSPRRHFPQRRFLGWSKKAPSEVAEIIGNYLVEVMRARGATSA